MSAEAAEYKMSDFVIDDAPLTMETIKNREDIQDKLSEAIPQLPAIEDETLDQLRAMLEDVVVNDGYVEQHIDFEYYVRNKDFFKRFFEFTINDSVGAMDTRKYINSLTNFNYNPFEGIRAGMLFSVQDRLSYLYRLGKIFNTDFLGNIDIKFTLHDIDRRMCKFIGEAGCPYELSSFEYSLIKSMFGKLILSIFSNVEYAFVQKTHCLSDDYVKNIKYIDRYMKDLCASDRYVKKSWSIFIDKLLDTKTMYKFSSYTELSARLKECYDNKVPIELLLADCIKLLIPSIGMSYIHVVKDVYIIGRLVTIYMNKYGVDKNNHEKMVDLVTIINSAYIDYETAYLSTAMLPRSMPECADNISEEFKLYYISHTLTGPQFYLLRQLVFTIPSLFDLA